MSPTSYQTAPPRINKLKRVSFAGVTIEGLKIGQYRRLSQKELTRIKRDYVNPVLKQGSQRPSSPDDTTTKIVKKTSRPSRSRDQGVRQIRTSNKRPKKK